MSAPPTPSEQKCPHGVWAHQARCIACARQVATPPGTIDTKQAVQNIWRNGVIPVVYRPPGIDPLMVRMPFALDNGAWLQGAHRSRPDWVERFKCWTLPRSWFTPLVDQLLNKFRQVYVIQPVRAHAKCAPACWNARGLECECSCLGVNHGAGQPEGRWYEISETCAVRWRDSELRWSLLKRPMVPGVLSPAPASPL